DHFLALDPTDLPVDLLEQHLLAAKTSIVAVGAARGTPRMPFFEGCSPSPLAPSYAFAAADDVLGAGDVGAASTSGKRRSSKGKGGKGGGGGSGDGGGGSSGGGGAGGGGGSGGSGGGSGGSGSGGGGSGGIGGSGSGGSGGGRTGAQRGSSGGGHRQQQHRRSETPPSLLPTLVSVQLADPSGGPVVARSSTVLPWSSLYTLATESPHVALSAQVSASRQVAPPCSCCLLSHQTLLWHRHLGHPSLPCLRGMHSRLLVSGLPRSLPLLPPSPAPPYLPCVEGRQRAAPHSSSFPPTTAPLQTLHMDVRGPARVSGQGHERYFLLVVDDYTRYTTVFPLCSKGQVVDVLIPWIRTVRLQLCEQFRADLPVLRLHSDRGGEFSSDLLREFCRGEGILQSFPLLDSPQLNGIAERRIGLVMEVARTSMIHAAVPHFLWPFAVRYAAHQLNLWPRVSLPETSPTLRWTGKVGDASVFWDVMFDESAPFYRLFPYRSAPPPPPPLFLAPDPPPVDPLPPQGPAPSGVSQIDPLPGTTPVQVAVGSSAARGAASGGAEPGVAESEGAGSGSVEPAGVEPGGAEPEGVEPGGAESEGVESGGVELQGAASSGGPAGALPRLSPQQLREWLVRRAHLRSGATGVEGAGAAGAGGAGVTAGAGGTGGTTATSPGGARTRGTGAAGTGGVGGAGAGDPTEPGDAGAGGSGAGGARAGGAGAGGTGAGGVGAGRAGGAGAVEAGAGGARAGSAGGPSAGGTVRPRPYFFPQLQQSRGLTERREPASHPASPVRTFYNVPRSRPPPVLGTHAMLLRPSSVALRVPLPAPPESSLLEVPHLESNRARAACPTVSRLLATAVSVPSFESAAASALIAEMVDLAAACRLDYASALVAEL
ncbi:unnamed protein product, partial [Closterium sp. NIES-53]